jgi:hypothetical protein
MGTFNPENTLRSVQIVHKIARADSPLSLLARFFAQVSCEIYGEVIGRVSEYEPRSGWNDCVRAR